MTFYSEPPTVTFERGTGMPITRKRADELSRPIPRRTLIHQAEAETAVTVPRAGIISNAVAAYHSFVRKLTAPHPVCVVTKRDGRGVARPVMQYNRHRRGDTRPPAVVF